jgi:putative isomerase
MFLNYKQIPFSMRGSYIALSWFDSNRKETNNRAGLFLRSIHGLTYIPNCFMGGQGVARLVPLYNGEEVPFEIEMTPSLLAMKTAFGAVEFTYANVDILLMRGGKGLGLRVEMDGGYIHERPFDGKVHHLLNSSHHGRRFITTALLGSIEVRQSWGQIVSEEANVTFGGEEGFLALVEDIETEWRPKTYDFDFNSCEETLRREFDSFCTSMPSVPAAFTEAKIMASYVDWTSIVKKSGMLTRDAMLMSKNWMCDIWSWDHCFNALALAYGNPKAAWDQFMLLFDLQDDTGAIPDAVNDVYCERLFCKPPVHGWILGHIMKVMELTREQIAEAYDKLSRFTLWWLNYRDSDLDGICEYFHGNDSGWDNSTAFRVKPTMELPDLAAFLILQMDMLSELAGRLGRLSDRDAWKNKADFTLDALLRHSFKNGKPKALVSRTHEEVETDCLILFLPVLLGDRLPKDILHNLVETLKSGKFRTAYGFASEAPDSPLYEEDGYWRGPIWAPSTMILAEGLWKAGEHAQARRCVEDFCLMVAKNGCAENFNALTGKGLRDLAYTWTSSIFLILAHEYLL